MLAYLARYTHRVAISKIAADADNVTFKVKDYQIEGPRRYTTMTLATHEFIRRFLIHVLPQGLPPHPPLRQGETVGIVGESGSAGPGRRPQLARPAPRHRADRPRSAVAAARGLVVPDTCIDIETVGGRARHVAVVAR